MPPLLHEALDTLEPLDPAEARDLQRMRELLRTCPTPLDRTVYEPGHVTGSGFIVARQTRQVALLRHKRLRIWLQPGGHADPHERDASEAARRESEEEMGLDLAGADGELFDIDIHPIPRTPREPAHLHYDARYLFVLGQPQVLQPESADAPARWLSIDEALALGLDPGVTRMIRKAEARGLLA